MGVLLVSRVKRFICSGTCNLNKCLRRENHRDRLHSKLSVSRDLSFLATSVRSFSFSLALKKTNKRSREQLMEECTTEENVSSDRHK